MRACESRAHPALFAFALAAYAYGRALSLWNFLLHAAKQNNSKGFIGAP